MVLEAYPLPPQISLKLGFMSCCDATLYKVQTGRAGGSDFVGKHSSPYVLKQCVGP